jgi:hypothetical protein
MDGVSKDMWVELTANIADIDYKMLNDRKISYRAVIDVKISAEKKVTHEIVTDIVGLTDGQVIKRPLELDKTVETRDDRFSVKDEFTLPDDKTCIAELLQTNVQIANKDVQVANGKVSVSGELVFTALYRGLDGENIIDFYETEIPFNGSFDVGYAREGMGADVTLRVRDHFAVTQKDINGDDRVLSVEAAISASIKVTSRVGITVMADAYCINKNVETVTEKVGYPKIICRNKNQYTVKDTVAVGPGCPDMLRVFNVTGQVLVDDVRRSTCRSI